MDQSPMVGEVLGRKAVPRDGGRVEAYAPGQSRDEERGEDRDERPHVAADSLRLYVCICIVMVTTQEAMKNSGKPQRETVSIRLAGPVFPFRAYAAVRTTATSDA